MRDGLQVHQPAWPGPTKERPMSLGTFFWYSIPQEHVSLEKVRRAWRAQGLPLRFLPESRKPADVAAEACNQVAAGAVAWATIHQTENSSTRLTYLVAPLGNTPEGTELVFDKATGEFACANGRVLELVRGTYEHNGSRLPPHKQRQALRAMLLAAGAENIHGSIYFLPENAAYGAELLVKTWQVVVTLYGEAAEFHRVPVEDTGLQRGYLIPATTRVIGEEMDELTREVNRMIDTERPRKWRSDKIENLVQRERALLIRAERIRDLLGCENLSERILAMREAVQEIVSLTEAPVIV